MVKIMMNIIMMNVSFKVLVTNIGNYTSDCVILGFISSDHEDAPITKLFDFQRVADLQPGQSVNVSLSMSPEMVSLVNIHGHQRILPGEYNIQIGEHNHWLNGKLILHGEEQSLFNLMEIKQNYQNKKQLTKLN